MVKFLHTADLHIGKSRTLPDYLDRQSAMLDGIYKAARNEDINIVLMAGDIFESKNIRWTEQKLFIEKLFQFDSEGFITIVANGNHDELAAGYSHMWLPAMIAANGGLRNTYIVDGEPQLVELDDIELAVIPVVHHNMSTKELQAKVEDMYGQASGSKPFVVMLHATISGANTDIGYNISGGPRIPDLGFVDYWAVGDIHKSQQIGEKAWYSGAPIQHDFGDAQPKGVLLVEVEMGSEPVTKLLELEGIKPLVTLMEKPEEWPTDCYIRYLGPLEGIIELPGNVIKTCGAAPESKDEEEQEAVQVEFTDSLTEGLAEYLNSKGISPEYQEMGLSWVAEKYIK